MPHQDDFLLDDNDAPSKRQILRCALHLFVRDGLCETSIRDISEASGYTNPALYKFFASKDALALYLFERCYHRMVTAVGDSQAADRDFESNLDAIMVTYAELIDEHLEGVIFVNETLRVLWPKLPRQRRPPSLLTIMRNLIRQGRSQGCISANVDVDLAVALVVGGMAQVARMAYFGELKQTVSSRVPALRRLFRAALLHA